MFDDLPSTEKPLRVEEDNLHMASSSIGQKESRTQFNHQ